MLWRRETRGGYGYVQIIPVRVVRVGLTGTAAVVQPLHPDGSGRDNPRRGPRAVRADSLSPIGSGE